MPESISPEVTEAALLLDLLDALYDGRSDPCPGCHARICNLIDEHIVNERKP